MTNNKGQQEAKSVKGVPSKGKVKSRTWLSPTLVPASLRRLASTRSILLGILRFGLILQHIQNDSVSHNVVGVCMRVCEVIKGEEGVVERKRKERHDE